MDAECSVEKGNLYFGPKLNKMMFTFLKIAEQRKLHFRKITDDLANLWKTTTISEKWYSSGTTKCQVKGC